MTIIPVVIQNVGFIVAGRVHGGRLIAIDLDEMDAILLYFSHDGTMQLTRRSVDDVYESEASASRFAENPFPLGAATADALATAAETV